MSDAAQARPPPDATDDAVEMIFLGTGTSTILPHVACLTAPANSPPCRSCLSTLTPAGKKNIRRNTSVVFRLRGASGEKVTVVIDVGKSFQGSAVEWFPKYGLRKIDAVLITHAHADAMNGLDDLRQWTLRSEIQPFVDLYVSQETFEAIQRTFPYLVSKEFASGGGDVPEFRWHIIEDKAPFQIGETGVWFTPFYVQHGRMHAKPEPLKSLSSKTSTAGEVSDESKLTPPNLVPFYCFGFKLNEDVVYMGDVSDIPDTVWSIIESLPSKKLPVLVLDTLRLDNFTSHFGVCEAVQAARRIQPQKTFLTGFSHDLSHDEWYTVLKTLEHGQAPAVANMTEMERKGVDMLSALEGEPLWVRSAYDGLRLYVGRDGSVRVEDYE